MAGKRKREGGPTREAKRLAHLFEELVRDRGTNQSEIGRKLGVHASYVNKWMSGEREGVGAEIISRACREYEVDPLYFVEDYEGLRSYREYPLRRGADVRELRDKVAKLERALGAPPDEDSKVRGMPRRRS